MVVIESARLMMRPLSRDDLDDFLALQSDPQVAAFTRSFDRPGALARLAEIEQEWAQRGHGGMAVLERRSRRFLGRSGLKRWPQFGETEIGWSLHPGEWGHGYATEAARAILEWGFESLPDPYFTAMVQPENTRSAAVARRLGLEPLREDELDGVPVVVYAIGRPASGG